MYFSYIRMGSIINGIRKLAWSLKTEKVSQSIRGRFCDKRCSLIIFLLDPQTWFFISKKSSAFTKIKDNPFSGGFWAGLNIRLIN